MESSTSSKSVKSSVSGALKRNSDDVGWEYGQLADPNNNDKVKCNLCQKMFSGGVYRIKEHIAQRGTNVTHCKVATVADQMKCANALDAVKRKKKAKIDAENGIRALVNINGDEPVDLDPCFGDLKEGRTFGPMDSFATFNGAKECSKQSNLNNVVRKEQVIRLKEYICQFAFNNHIPFHAFESDSFKMMLAAVGQFGPNAEPPTRYEMGGPYLKKAVEKTRASLKRNEDEWKFLGCSIMTDAWSDRNRRSIMNLCVNSKLGTVFLSSKECSGEAHTKEMIFEYVDKCIEEVGPENVIQVVTDNASNNMGAAKLLKEKRSTIFWTSCATHTINLMLEGIGGLARYKKTLDEAKKLTNFIYAHHKTLALMRKFTLKRNIVKPGVTRFASSFLTLESLEQRKSQLKLMFLSPEWEASSFAKTVNGKVAYKTVVSTAFWTGVTRCLNIFEPLVVLLRMVDADWKPSMGFIYGELQKAKIEIQGALNNNARAYKPIMDIINSKLVTRLDTCLHLTSYILNPYYMYNNDLNVRDDVDATDAIVEFVSEVYPKQDDLHNIILNQEWPMYRDKAGKFSREVALKACKVNNECFDPANWWETYGNSCPNLKKMAMRILSLTSSSSGCERNWSMFEGVHTKKRNRLEPGRVSDLVYVEFNANLIEKNKKRKLRNREVLLADADGGNVEEWITGRRSEPRVVDNEVQSGPGMARTSEPRGIDDEFESEDEVEDVEIEYESDGVEIITRGGGQEQGGGQGDELDELDDL